MEAKRISASEAPSRGETYHYDHILSADTTLLVARHGNVLYSGQIRNHEWPNHHRTQGHLQFPRLYPAAHPHNWTILLYYLDQAIEGDMLTLFIAVCELGREARWSDFSSERHLTRWLSRRKEQQQSRYLRGSSARLWATEASQETVVSIGKQVECSIQGCRCEQKQAKCQTRWRAAASVSRVGLFAQCRACVCDSEEYHAVFLPCRKLAKLVNPFLVLETELG